MEQCPNSESDVTHYYEGYEVILSFSYSCSDHLVGWSLQPCELCHSYTLATLYATLYEHASLDVDTFNLGRFLRSQPTM